MLPLPKITKKWDCEWEILEREGDYAIIKQTGGGVNFNVVKILKAPASTIGGNVIPAKEKIPTDSKWGTYAWNYLTLEKAQEKFEECKKKNS